MRRLFPLMILCALFSTSCARVVLGLRQPRGVTAGSVAPLRTARGPVVPVILDTAYFSRLDAAVPDSGMRKDYFQPLQLWLYDGDSVRYAIVNCDAEFGFPYLRWNMQPITREHARMALGKYLSFSRHLQLLQPYAAVPQPRAHEAVVVYSLFMGRQKKGFMRAVEKALNSSWNVRYFCAENLYANLH